MASSPLTLALLAGQGGMPQDPALLPYLQKSGLAQAMVQNATDGSPTNKWGALSRLAQGLLGGYEMNDVTSGIQNVVKQRQQDTMNALSYMRGGGGALPGGVPAGVAPGTVPAQPDIQPAPQPSTQPAMPAGGATANPAPAPTQTASNNLPTPPLPPGQTPSPQLTYAVHTLESGGSMQPGITGDGGNAAGPMQVHQAALDDVNKATGNNYTLAQVQADPMLGMSVGKTYLSLMQKRFPGRPDLALAAYNAGPTATQNAVDSGAGVGGLPASTQAYVAKGTQLAGGAPAVQPDVPGQPTQAVMPPVGTNSPNVAAALAQMRRAQEAAIANPYNPQIQQAAQMQMQQAQILMGMDHFQDLPGIPGGQINTTSGQKTFAPAGRPFMDSSGRSWMVDATGQPHLLAAPTPQEIQTYHQSQSAGAAAGAAPYHVQESQAVPQRVAPGETVYMPPNPFVSGQQRGGGVPAARPGPSGPTGAPSAPSKPSAPGAPAISVNPAPNGGQTIAGSFAPKTIAGMQADQGNLDSQAVAKEAEAARAGQGVLGTTQTIRSMLPSVATGPGADPKLVASQISTAFGISPETAQKYIGTNPVSGEILQKKLFELTTGATRQLGAREPGMVLQMFQKNYPSMNSQNMTVDAMTRLLDMDQVRNQDQANAKQAYLHDSIQGINDQTGYRGLQGFDNQFEQTNSPKIYAAAGLAAGHIPYAQWSRGLTPQEQSQALKLVARVYPQDGGAMGPGQGGSEVWHTMGGGGG